MGLETEPILIRNDSLHAEKAAMCEHEGLTERDRFSEVPLILITVRYWSTDNDVGWNFYIDLKLMAFRVLENILLIESGVPKNLNCPFTGTRQADLFFFFFLPVSKTRTFCCFHQAWGDGGEVQEPGEQARRSAGDRWAQRHGDRERIPGQEAGGECVSVLRLYSTHQYFISSVTFQRLFYDGILSSLISVMCLQSSEISPAVYRMTRSSTS